MLVNVMTKKRKHIVSRNPVAKYAWKFNSRKTIPPKKGRGSVYKRNKKIGDNE